MIAIAIALSAAPLEDCVAVGDSLALGIATIVNRHVRGTSCRIEAVKGEPSSEILRRMRPVHADVVIISAGANDAASPDLPVNLYSIRRSIVARQVIWVIPRDARAAGAARYTCQAWHDVGVDLRRFESEDGVHPRDYWPVARAAFASTRCG